MTEAASRAIEMLRVAARYIAENGLVEHEVHYDDADCDGHCLIEDLTLAADDLEDSTASTVTAVQEGK